MYLPEHQPPCKKIKTFKVKLTFTIFLTLKKFPTLVVKYDYYYKNAHFWGSKIDFSAKKYR